MRTDTGMALYGLSIDCYLEGLMAEAPQHQEFGLNVKQAVEVRKARYADRIRRIRAKRAA